MPPRVVRHGMLVGVAIIAWMFVASRADDTTEFEAVLAKVAAARQQPDGLAKGLAILNDAIGQHADAVPLLMARAGVLEEQRTWKECLADYDRLVTLAPNHFEVYHRRGGARFKAGDVKGSITDFDRAIQLNPSLERRHWQRGLSYFYDGQFAAGAKQFELYQTYHASDVENIAWKFLCQAKVDGVEKARQEMMPLSGNDPRIPMKEIDAMYRGKMSPDQVMAAATAGNPAGDELIYRQFYAHLYVGLFYEATDQLELGRQHMLEADKLQNDHYMWDVAHLHVARYQK